MSTPAPTGNVRAAVTGVALEPVRRHAPPSVDVVALEDGVDPEAIDFLVPPSDGGGHVLEVLPELHRLAVVQVLSAGTDWIENRLPPQAALCSARGARDAPVSEWVLGALLGATTGLLECARIQTWTDRHLTDLGGWTVLIVGMGSIGRMVQSRLEMLGTQVMGVASHARDDLHGVDELPDLLPAADAVVVLVPLSPATRGLIGAAELAAMADGSLLVNAARGSVVDTRALVPEVTTGRLRAVLDVSDPEPLPDGHPLWTAPGVLTITPHIAGDSPLGQARAAALAGEQLARWCAGEPLRNVVRDGSA
ncbi:MAG TPA: NAD(P)-dependent oxidoreductase [Solirubrobacteraceae bacterium]|nr:NAD(P)-dependent oxidoreductase [Solirubrobacteraceae bacterium]